MVSTIFPYCEVFYSIIFPLFCLSSSYNVNSQKQEVKGGDAAMHLEVTDEKKHPKPWNSYFW